MKTNAGSTNWYNAPNLCKDIWHLPSQDEFNALILAYYPSALYDNTYHGGYYYESNTTGTYAFSTDWGTTSGAWWSSTAHPTQTSFAYFLRLSSTGIYLDFNTSLTYDNQIVRCVSS